MALTQEGMPSDEQGKTMLYAALKLRLSLVGSMLGSICVSETATLEWVPLLMQLICSGAVDRQTDSRYVGKAASRNQTIWLRLCVPSITDQI